MKNIVEMLQALKEAGHYVVDRENKVVLTREHLGEMLSVNYSEAVEVYNTGLIEETLMIVDPEIHSKFIELKAKYQSPESVIFCLSYLLNPNLLLSYKEISYRDIAKLGRHILTSKANEKVVLEMMNDHLFSFYAQIKDLDSTKPGTFEMIQKAENYINVDAKVAYYVLGYVFSSRKWYVYNGVSFKQINNLYVYLVKNNLLNKFSKSFEYDLLFIAWLYYLGKADVYEAWANDIDTIDNLDYEVNNNPVPTEVKLHKEKAKKSK